MATLITEDFSGTLGNWTQSGSYASISSGTLIFTGEGMIRHNTACGTGDKWMRFRMPVTPNQTVGLLFSGDASGNSLCCMFSIYDASTYQAGYLTRYTTYTTWAADQETAEYITWTYNAAQYLGVTYEYTAKVLRFWGNVTAAAPTSITAWDGGACTATITSTPANYGHYVGFGSWTSTPGTGCFDDFTAGDFGGEEPPEGTQPPRSMHQFRLRR